MGDWAHAPAHDFSEAGAYIVTGGTYLKQHFLKGAGKLDTMQDVLFGLAEEYGCELQAWALFSNHYHIVTLAPEDPSSLESMFNRLHSVTATLVNRLDGVEGRKVMYQFWDKHLTYRRSYLPRLNYVHNNPVKHGIVPVASHYKWCSAGWFERKASPAFVKTVMSFKTDKLNVYDDFDVECGE